jgi:hypothetical protein
MHLMHLVKLSQKKVFNSVLYGGAVVRWWVGAIEKSMLISSIEEIMQ